MMRRFALLVGLLLPLMPTNAIAELVNLDDFIAGIEKGGLDGGCVPKGPLANFIGQLIERYSLFADGSRIGGAPVKIPVQFAAAIGKASAQSHKDGHSIIRVPLVGTYRGLRTRELIVHTGHENGYSETRILFAASKDEVEAIIGREIVPAGHPAGFNGKVIGRNKGSELICDTST